MRLLHDLFEHYQLVRRLTLAWCLVVTSAAVNWSFEFASAHPESTATAAIIGAVMAPVAALQGWVMQIYTSGRKDG